MPDRMEDVNLNSDGVNLVPGGDATGKLNSMALLGFVLAFFINVGGLAVSIVALVQIKKTGERGRGLAIGGIVIGALSILLTILAIIARR